MDGALHLIEELGCGEITASAFDDAGAPKEGKKFTATLSGINKKIPSRSRQNVLDYSPQTQLRG